MPAEHQIRGLGPITLSVPDLAPTDAVLTAVMDMRPVRDLSRTRTTPTHTVHVYEMGAGGPAAELHVAVQPDLPAARQGAGGVHHVAFRTPRRRIRRLGGAAAASCASRTAARSTASISAASISASRTASCSRSPPTAPASRPTSRWRRSASGWRCRRSSSRAAPISRRASSRTKLLAGELVEQRLHRRNLIRVHRVAHAGIDAFVHLGAETQGEDCRRLVHAFERDVSASTSLQPRKTGVPASEPG